MDFVRENAGRSGLPDKFFYKHLGISADKFISWKSRYGKVNEHNGFIPRDFWLEPWEKEAIVKFYIEHDLEGYRRCTYLMIDQNVAYCSASTVYRVLTGAGVLRSRSVKKSRKGTGFEQPLKPHAHWHTDITNVHIGDTIYFLISVIDGFSRFVVHWELRESMKDTDTALTIQRAKEKFPNETPRLISDNGSQYKSKDFRELLTKHEMTHVTTSPYYPQSNGKQERWHQTIKSEAIRVSALLTMEDAKRIIGNYVNYYNEERLHSAIDYVTPLVMLEGRQKEVLEERTRKLEHRREERRSKRKSQQNTSVEAAKTATTRVTGAQEQNRISAEGCSEAALCRICS